jgi:hypothetical protein
LQPSISEPFVLLDESLSRHIALEVSATTGCPIVTVWDEWRERDLSVERLPDEEIIPHLGAKAGQRAVWITQDWNALRDHRRLIAAHGISVLWLRGPGGRNFLREEQPSVLIAVLETVRRLVIDSNSPIYLRARFNPDGGSRPILERLQGTLLDTPLLWQRVPLG